MEEILHEILHAFIETLKTVPFLFLAYLLMEYIEHKASEKMEASLEKIGRSGPALTCGRVTCDSSTNIIKSSGK